MHIEHVTCADRLFLSDVTSVDAPEKAASWGHRRSVCASLTLCRALTGGTCSVPGEKEQRRSKGSLGHLFRFDWWVLAGERGTSVVWQCQALHVTATLVGPIVLSAKNSNHFKSKCLCCVCVCVSPSPSCRCTVVCTQSHLNVASGNVCGSPGKSEVQQNQPCPFDKDRLDKWRTVSPRTQNKQDWFHPALVKHWL